MRQNIDTGSMEDYEKFLRIKGLPKFSFIGRTAEYPDEYAELVNSTKCEPELSQTAYEPLAGLFDYQEGIARLAIRKRKFAAFVEPGYGKTLIYGEYARHVLKVLPKHQKILMFAPLMVVTQTIQEYAKFYGTSLPIEQIKSRDLTAWDRSGSSRFGITNYEALKDEISLKNVGALICDESSCIRSFSGKHAQKLIELGKGIDWKLCGTGTPAPNDRIEYANHAVLLDHYPTVNSFLARFFVNRGETSGRWELKPHAVKPFYHALSHWCIFLTNPATYGWKDNAGTLPPINIHIHDVPLSGEQREMVMARTGDLFGIDAGGMTGRSALGQISKGSFQGRKIETNKPAFIRKLVDSWPTKSTLIWCIYNAEQETMERAFPDAHSIDGATKYEDRIRMVDDFKAGRNKVLISKADVLGFGLNLQIATKMVFSGIEDSYESFWQCVKRANRVGSTEALDVHLPITAVERPMMENVLKKAKRVQADTEEQERIFKESNAHLAAELAGMRHWGGELF